MLEIPSSGPGTALQVGDVFFTYNGGLADGTTDPFTVTVSTKENPTDEECDLTNNEDSATVATPVNVVVWLMQ